MAKKVGSNFFLMNRRLSANLNFAFAALASGGGIASAAPNDFAISQMVPLEGIEPPSSRPKRDTLSIKLQGRFFDIIIQYGDHRGTD